MNGRRKTVPKTKNLKLVPEYSVLQQLKSDFDVVELSLENNNLKKTIGLLEGRNKILEDHCNLLKEKNHYYEVKLRDLQNEIQDNDVSDKDVDSEKDETGSEKKSLIDRLSGVVFGFALPKLGDIFRKIRDKRNEIKSLIEENGGDDDFQGCPLQKGDFKEKIEVLKVNLFRVAIVLATLAIASGVGYGGYKIWKSRYRQPSYLIPSDDEDDSGEELFRTPPTRVTDTILKTNSTDSFETPGISTDFKSILDTANKK